MKWLWAEGILTCSLSFFFFLQTFNQKYISKKCREKSGLLSAIDSCVNDVWKFLNIGIWNFINIGIVAILKTVSCAPPPFGKLEILNWYIFLESLILIGYKIKLLWKFLIFSQHFSEKSFGTKDVDKNLLYTFQLMVVGIQGAWSANICKNSLEFENVNHPNG